MRYEKICITGGAGFIGANFIYYMLEKYPKKKIICLDDLTYAGNIKTLDSAMKNENFRFYKVNICDRAMVIDIFNYEKPDIVINFAAESHVDRSIENPSLFLETNILGTEVLLDASIKVGVKRFHQVSTDEVYGDLPLDKPNMLFTEKSKIKPSSPYSVSKASADFLVYSYHRTFGLPITISRCSNNYGPFQFPEKLIPLMILKALNDEELPVYGDGLNIRDWLHVDDHCKALDNIIVSGKIGEIYNIGGNNEKKNIEIVNIILEKLGKPISLIKYVEDRKGHDRRYAVNPKKVKIDTGWEPNIRFEDGIIDTISWYINNSHWWKPILNGDYRDINITEVSSK